MELKSKDSGTVNPCNPFCAGVRHETGRRENPASQHDGFGPVFPFHPTDGLVLMYNPVGKQSVTVQLKTSMIRKSRAAGLWLLIGLPLSILHVRGAVSVDTDRGSIV
jgi:hypothetical protein